jgi:hypothetical protein
MIKTIIKSVYKEAQRYETLGDYYMEDGIRVFSITKTGNQLYDDLIFIHEFIEEVLTRNNGITEEEILKYDLEFEERIKRGEVDPNAEPGEQFDSPYKVQHSVAESVERIMLNHLGEDFIKYNETIMKIFNDANN